MTEPIPYLNYHERIERRPGLARSAGRVVNRPDDRAEPGWIEASFMMKADAAEPSSHEQRSWEFRGPCPGTPVIRASFRRAGRELLARILLQPPVSDAFRVALRFNPISFLSHHNSTLKELLASFTQVTSVDFQLRPRSRPF